MEYLGRIAGALKVDITELFRKSDDFVALVRLNGKTFDFDSLGKLKEWIKSNEET